jgi:long-chain fatty acid transport protein
MGTAVVAIADDLSAICYNPAGLVNLRGTHTYDGITSVLIKTLYENPQGQSEKTQFQIFSPFHLYLSSDLGMEHMTFGLGIFSPFGIGGRKWDEEGLTRYVSTESLIGTLAFNPSIALRILPELSIGVGLDYYYAYVKSKRKLNQSALASPDGRFKFKADGGGVGFNVGLLYKASEKVSIGLAYRSRVNVDMKGEVLLKDIAVPLQPIFGGYQFKTDAETTYHFPNMVNVGIGFRPTKRWTLGFEIEWVDWQCFSKSHLDIKKEVPGAGFTDVSVDLGWKSGWLIKFGMEYLWSETFALRGGYVYSKSPVTERTLSPDSPDSDQHHLAIGLGYKRGKFLIDIFYNLGIFEERKVMNPILSGKFETLIHSLGLSLGYQF